jgi:hypothetical protein
MYLPVSTSSARNESITVLVFARRRSWACLHWLNKEILDLHVRIILIRSQYVSGINKFTKACLYKYANCSIPVFVPETNIWVRSKVQGEAMALATVKWPLIRETGDQESQSLRLSYRHDSMTALLFKIPLYCSKFSTKF